MKPLKEQIPKGDQRGKQTLIKGELLQGRQLEQGAAGQKLDEAGEEAGRGQGEVFLSIFWFLGVFLDNVVCIQ